MAHCVGEAYKNALPPNWGSKNKPGKLAPLVPYSSVLNVI
jgi:hypothetical protein